MTPQCTITVTVTILTLWHGYASMLTLAINAKLANGSFKELLAWLSVLSNTLNGLSKSLYKITFNGSKGTRMTSALSVITASWERPPYS